ncbi:MAG: CHAD domain-containing protein [Acidobacteriia bacterium]|nr:CHAD domain-containing protein [Terriglobia bacterium]
MAKHGRLVWNGSKSAEENASRKLPQLARTYFRAGRALFAAESTPESLHKFRLKSKRFRYTLELFQPCYGPGLEERLKLLRNIQDLLGEINDCVTTRKLVAQNQPAVSKFLERRMAVKKRALRSYWFQTFAAAGQENWWANYLARFVRKPGRAT